jgi:hypothetical protein
MGPTPGLETPVIPDGPDDSTVVMVGKGMGWTAGVGSSFASGCLVIYWGGWYVNLLPKKVKKIKSIEY